MDAGLLILRLVVGLYLFGHGAQKLFGWFGGRGLRPTITMMNDVLGFRPAALWTVLEVCTETGAGLLLALGFLAPLGALGVAASMLVAVGVRWSKGVWERGGGYELALTNLAAAVAVGLTGPGAYSIDALAGTALPAPSLVVGSGLAAAGGIVALASRRPVAAASQAARPAGR